LMKLIITQFSVASNYFIQLRSSYSPWYCFQMPSMYIL
jgi:hypothetical protein